MGAHLRWVPPRRVPILMGAHPADGYPARCPAKLRGIWSFVSSLGKNEFFGILLYPNGIPTDIPRGVQHGPGVLLRHVGFNVVDGAEDEPAARR